ncbi:hypothetical protein BOTBODRAFT_178453 [Botryobasidium botryosum FD-172 SS1]|uniref:Uncharacterized protein n=1 Tax=Botryobasidium botryosum (strain FD-172 SS1) TaxID=930990 RepID=A0A067M5U0_BOTB1|nr:hypothetical protein BOTBODRAFT_178453 [Botryobasidium botryosum FD-172 SS1]
MTLTTSASCLQWTERLGEQSPGFVPAACAYSTYSVTGSDRQSPPPHTPLGHLILPSYNPRPPAAPIAEVNPKVGALVPLTRTAQRLSSSPTPTDCSAYVLPGSSLFLGSASFAQSVCIKDLWSMLLASRMRRSMTIFPLVKGNPTMESFPANLRKEEVKRFSGVIFCRIAVVALGSFSGSWNHLKLYAPPLLLHRPKQDIRCGHSAH